VGGLSEADVKEATQIGAIIFTFDTPMSQNMQKIQTGCVVKMHKLIYKFTESIQDLCDDLLAQEGAKKPRVVGEAVVQDVFNMSVKIGGQKKEIVAAGSKVKAGTILKDKKFRIKRSGYVLYDHLKLQALKQHKEDVEQVETLMECGVTFKNCTDVKKGDIIECYEEVEPQKKFDFTPGIWKSY